MFFGFFLCFLMSFLGLFWMEVGLGEGWGYECCKVKIEEYGFCVFFCGDIDINVV